jgi:hypothetical protein
MTKIVDYIVRAIARLLMQFKSSPKLKGLVSVLAGQAQEIEDALWDTQESVRDINIAYGATLTRIGQLIGAPARGLYTDAQYRPILQATIIANNTAGSAADIYAISKFLVLPWAVAGQPRITEDARAVYEISANPRASIVNTTEDAIRLSRMLNDVSAAGVRAIVHSQPQTEALSFAFAGGTGLGFGAGDLVAAYDK